MKPDVPVKTKFSIAHFFLLLIPMQIIVFGCFFAYEQYARHRRLFFDNEQFEKNCAIAYLCEIMSDPYIHQDICNQYSSCLAKTNSKGWFTEGIPDLPFPVTDQSFQEWFRHGPFSNQKTNSGLWIDSSSSCAHHVEIPESFHKEHSFYSIATFDSDDGILLRLFVPLKCCKGVIKGILKKSIIDNEPVYEQSIELVEQSDPDFLRAKEMNKK